VHGIIAQCTEYCLNRCVFISRQPKLAIAKMRSRRSRRSLPSKFQTVGPTSVKARWPIRVQLHLWLRVGGVWPNQGAVDNSNFLWTTFIHHRTVEVHNKYNGITRKNNNKHDYALYEFTVYLLIYLLTFIGVVKGAKLLSLSNIGVPRILRMRWIAELDPGIFQKGAEPGGLRDWSPPVKQNVNQVSVRTMFNVFVKKIYD